jgi:tetratricopeptide (TPR) repeat protein/predicted nucleic acid-binding protein
MKIKDRFQKDGNAFLNLAITFADQGKHKEAKELFLKSINLEPDVPENYFSLGSYLLEYVMKDRIWTFGLTSEQIDELKEAEGLLGKSIDLLKNTQKKALIQDAYINRSTVRIILDNFVSALEDIDAALAINPKSHSAYANRARLNTLKTSQDLDAAIEDFKLALKNGAERETVFPLLITCYLERQDPKIDEAIAEIKAHYTKQEIESSITPSALLVESLIKKKDFVQSESILKEMYSKFGRDPRILLTEAGLRRAQSNMSLFESLTNEASNQSKGIEKNVAEMQLAKHYKNIGAYDKAIPLYASFISETLFDGILRDYLVCLYKSKENRNRNIQKCLAICQKLRINKSGISFLMELEASIYEGMDRLEEAGKLYYELSKLESNNHRHKLNYAKILIHVGKGQEKEGARLLFEIKDKVADKDSLIMLAKSFLKIYEYDEAIKQIFRALEIDSNNPEIQLLYMFAFINRKDKKSPLLDSETVKEGFRVKFRKNGQEQEYLISSDPKASITRFELYKDSGLGRMIYGKRKGDNIVMRNEFGVDESVAILEIKSKYVKAFQNIIDNFSTYFPDNKAMFKIDADPSKIKDLLQKSGERSSKIMEMYYSKNITIGALSAFSGRSLFTVWGALLDQNTKLYCAIGSPDEQKRERDLISRTSSVLLDQISLYTLAYLDILILPAKLFKEVFVAQASIDEIKMEILELAKGADEGSMTLFYRDGKPFRQEIPAEFIKKRIEFLQRIVSCPQIRTIGLDNILEKDLKEKEKILGRSYIYSIQNCLEKKCALFCDDLLFRELVYNEYKIESFSMQNFLVQAMGKNLINEDTYFDKIIELAKINYFYLSISAQMLFYCAEKTSFQVAKSNDFKALIKILNSKETSLDSLVLVLADFMKLIFVESLPEDMKDNYLNTTLTILSSRNNPKRISRIFSKVLSGKLGNLLNFKMAKINKKIDGWLKINYPVI